MNPFSMKAASAFVAFVCLFVLVGCSVGGGDDIPLGVTSYTVYLFDARKAPNGDYYAGTIETGYLSRKENLAKARALALSEARRLGFDTSHARYYIICTVTKDSSCVTKIR